MITIALLSCVKKVATMGSEKKVMMVMKAMKVKEKTMKAMKAWKEKNNKKKKMKKKKKKMKKKKKKKKKKKQDEEMKKRMTLLTKKEECARAAFRKCAKGGKATAMRSWKDLENVWELNRRAMYLDLETWTWKHGSGERRTWTWKTWKLSLIHI